MCDRVKKLAIVNKIDVLLSSINKPTSNYDLIVDTLSITQLNYYLELTKTEVFYNGNN
jgi:hypothetical protein